MKLELKLIGLLILTNFFNNIVYSQVNFERNDSIIVIQTNGDTLKNPWAGGFNSVQFSEIDLDLDGIKDLFVFDRTGNRISTFINAGTPNSVTYKHDPSYIKFFPEGLHDWVLLRDYNCDGKMDIFTYASGGMAAYSNTSTSQLSFKIDTSLVHSDFQPNFINLYISSTDIPAIDDIDGDGDLDVLTFSILGSYVEYHKNLSMERYGNCDSLDFQLTNKCWGYFKENFSSNSVTLYDTCSFNVINPEKKHAGSTLFTLDVDANNSKELVLGDVSFNNFTMLVNSDTSANLTQSTISAQDSLFPQNNNSSIATNIEIFPAGFYLDVNNDNVKDLIAAPNCYTGCKNKKNVWYYNNRNQTNNPDFKHETSAFLQDGMIEVGEGGQPVFFDYNADGLMDIVVGNYGVFDSNLIPLLYKSSLTLYENVGTASKPVYKLVNSDYLNISTMNLDIAGSRPTLGLYPAFGDMDDDGDVDMFIGDYNGHIHYFKNTAGPGNPANLSLSSPNYLGIDVGANATPFVYDLNKDSLPDLIIGKDQGTFSYYENQGSSTSPNLVSITDSLGKVDTKRLYDSYGHSNPVFIDSAGTTIMYSGAKNGYIYKFTNIDGNINGTFETDSAYLNIWEGINSKVSIYDITNDSNLEMLVGNYSGGVALYKGKGTVSPIGIKENISLTNLNIYPNPTKNTITIDTQENNLNNASIQIIDVLGKEVVTQKVSNKITTINLLNYSKGIYFVKFSNHLGSKVYKLIKE